MHFKIILIRFIGLWIVLRRKPCQTLIKNKNLKRSYTFDENINPKIKFVVLNYQRFVDILLDDHLLFWLS